MPFSSESLMDARRRFIRDLFSSSDSLTEVSRRHGVSRQTGAMWRDRALELGLESLAEKSRAPTSRPNATPEAVVELIVVLRRRYPRWGPAKLRAILLRDYPGLRVPATSTVGAILKREGLVVPRRRRTPRGLPPPSHLGPQDRPNQSWSMDHKGDFKLGNGRRCHPFTLLDAATRFLFALEAFPSTRGELVKEALVRVFEEHGLPEAMRSDNGSPFAASTFTGLTRLAVWLVELGIRLDRIDPGKPQQNGRLERYHRTVKEACCAPPEATLADQQRAFDEHRTEYNEVRPHASLEQNTPASAHEPSPRPFPKHAPEPDYGDAHIRKVNCAGVAAFKRWRLQVGQVLEGKIVGLVPQDDDTFEVRFHARTLGWFDPSTGTLHNGRDVRRCNHASNWPSKRR